jgi:hypothetical protein
MNLNQIGLQNQTVGFIQKFHYVNNFQYTKQSPQTPKHSINITFKIISIIHDSTVCSKQQHKKKTNVLYYYPPPFFFSSITKPLYFYFMSIYIHYIK